MGVNWLYATGLPTWSTIWYYICQQPRRRWRQWQPPQTVQKLIQLFVDWPTPNRELRNENWMWMLPFTCVIPLSHWAIHLYPRTTFLPQPRNVSFSSFKNCLMEEGAGSLIRSELLAILGTTFQQHAQQGRSILLSIDWLPLVGLWEQASNLMDPKGTRRWCHQDPFCFTNKPSNYSRSCESCSYRTAEGSSKLKE
jgi:hypothetical protein